MWAAPRSIFFRSRRRRPCPWYPFVLPFKIPPYFFLLATGSRPFARALVLERWPRTGRPLAVAHAAIAANFNQPLDIEGNVPAEVTLHMAVLVDIISPALLYRLQTGPARGCRGLRRWQRRCWSRSAADAVNIGKSISIRLSRGKSIPEIRAIYTSMVLRPAA